MLCCLLAKRNAPDAAESRHHAAGYAALTCLTRAARDYSVVSVVSLIGSSWYIALFGCILLIFEMCFNELFFAMFSKAVNSEDL